MFTGKDIFDLDMCLLVSITLRGHKTQMQPAMIYIVYKWPSNIFESR